MFSPHHVSASAWREYLKKGYTIKLFVLPKMRTEHLDAEQFLSSVRDMYTSFETIEDNGTCVFVKIAHPDGNCVCLRMDRDYTEIYGKATAGNVTTLASWQPASRFRGYTQQELWCNMVELLNRHAS